MAVGVRPCAYSMEVVQEAVTPPAPSLLVCDDEVQRKVWLGFFLWHLMFPFFGRFSCYPWSWIPALLLVQLRVALLCSVVWNPRWLKGICHCCSSLTENNMGSGFDGSVVCRKVIIIPAENEMCSRVNVTILPQTAWVFVSFMSAGLFC